MTTPSSESSAPDPTPAAQGTDRTLVVVLIIVAVLIVAALVAVFARGAAPQFDPSTPEGTVQRYSSAVVANDLETARSLHVASMSSEGCVPTFGWTTSSLRLALVDTQVSGDNAVVTVTVTQGYAGPFSGDYSYDDRFELERAPGGDWFVSVAPWNLQVCELDEKVVR